MGSRSEAARKAWVTRKGGAGPKNRAKSAFARRMGANPRSGKLKGVSNSSHQGHGYVRVPNHASGGATFAPRGGAALQIWQRKQWGD